MPLTESSPTLSVTVICTPYSAAVQVTEDVDTAVLPSAVPSVALNSVSTPAPRSAALPHQEVCTGILAALVAWPIRLNCRAKR